MKLDKKDLLLYAVTDRSWLGDKTLSKQVAEAIDGGTTFIQLREKELSPEEFYSEAIEIKQLCQDKNIPFVINDNVDLAVKVKADGVHIGQDDMSVKEARKQIGSKKILGVSAQTVEQAIKAQKDGADYLGVGAIHPTDSKTDADIVSLKELKKICEAVEIPVIAIGGLNAGNLNGLKDTGIVGIAVISALFAAEDIKAAANELSIKLKEIISDD